VRPARPEAIVTWFDHLFVLALLIGLPAYAAWEVPRLARRLEADPAYARTKDYLWTIALQWALTLGLLVWWLLADRPVADLGLVAPQGANRSWTIVVAAAAVAFFASQARTVARSADAQAKVRAQLDSQPSVLVILPATPGEMRTFGALAITAGICEEILYRGYLLYYLRAMLPGAAAVVAAIVVFGLAHAYQGRRGILLTGIAGAAAMGLYLFTGSLAASIVLHATVDLANGYMAYLSLTAAPRAAA
jgi:membrane protease YdiL (CAAX protease family)